MRADKDQWTREHTVWCNNYETCGEYLQMAESILEQARKQAHVSGWRRLNGRWYCPPCQTRDVPSAVRPVHTAGHRRVH